MRTQFKQFALIIIAITERVMWRFAVGRALWYRFTKIGRKHNPTMKIAVVGDLSGGDPYRLGKVIHAAIEVADVVIQVGDLHPGYDIMREAAATGKVFPVRGNHDVGWDAAWPLQWLKTYPDCLLVGIDNSSDTISQTGWDTLAQVDAIPNPPAIFVFAHKSPVPLILPDGSESLHIQGEGNACPDGERLTKWLNSKGGRATMICGHLHSWSLQKTQEFDLILDGRGGAAPDLAFSLILVQHDGWVVHSVPVN